MLWVAGHRKRADGRAPRVFLPSSHISSVNAAHFYKLAQDLTELPDSVGEIATDLPYRQIEYTVDGKTRTITGYTTKDQADHDAHRFNEVWNEIVKLFRSDRSVVNSSSPPYPRAFRLTSPR